MNGQGKAAVILGLQMIFALLFLNHIGTPYTLFIVIALLPWIIYFERQG